MNNHRNLRQLVLRRDTATGVMQVGWESDLPVGRFEHITLIYEATDNILPDINNKNYAAYQSALLHAFQSNSRLLEQQIQINQEKGWYHVPFTLARNPDAMQADSTGLYVVAAMRLQHELTQNRKPVWAVIQSGTIVHVRSRYPATEMDELTFQVWYHRQKNQLLQLDGILMEGNLLICESGLWFVEG